MSPNFTNLRAIPIIVPAPNSYSRRICSYNSTLALQSNSRLRIQAHRSNPDKKSAQPRVGQNKMPKWATLECQSQK